jgi:very-short-patch-repair endonuclease
VTTVERTLLDLGQFKRHEVVVEKALESAIRKGLTTEAKVRLWLETGRRRGRKGVTLLRHVLDLREGGRPAGSGAEVSLIRLLRRAGVPRAVRQHSIRLRHDEVAVVDLAWPGRRVAVEFDGFEHHGGRRAWYHGIARDNAIRDAGWTLRRYTWDDLTKRPEAIVEAVFRLLCASAAA